MANEAVPAATLILVRDRLHGSPELLMVTRSKTMAFAPGALVFPGGRIDRTDVTLNPDDRGAKAAAVRETIEECAIAAGFDRAVSPEETRALQDALLNGRDFPGLLLESGLALDASALIPFARWVPGLEVARRFDTAFFIARASGDAIPHVGSAECDSAEWLSAGEALDRERRGGARLIYPTRKNLERLAQFDSFDAILADAHNHPVTPITARVEGHGQDRMVRIPDGLGYPTTSDRLTEVWRG